MPLNPERKVFIAEKADILQRKAFNEHFSNILSVKKKSIYKDTVQVQQALLADLKSKLEASKKSYYVSRTEADEKAVNGFLAAISNESCIIDIIVEIVCSPSGKSRLTYSKCTYDIQEPDPDGAKHFVLFRYQIPLDEKFIDLDPKDKELVNECRRKIAHEIAHLDLLVDSKFIGDNYNAKHTCIPNDARAFDETKHEEEADYYAQNLIRLREDFHYNYLTTVHKNEFDALK